MPEMTPQQKIEACRNNVIASAIYCIKSDFSDESQAMLKYEIARLESEIAHLDPERKLVLELANVDDETAHRLGL